jgi:hypothetical protein
MIEREIPTVYVQKNWLTAEEVKELYDISRNQLLKLRNEGKIPYICNPYKRGFLYSFKKIEENLEAELERKNQIETRINNLKR